MQGDNKGFLVARQKVYTTVEQLCRFHSAPFQQFLEYVLSLQFLEAPQYQLCQQLFEPLLEEPSQRPLARAYVTAAQAVKVQTPPHPFVKVQRPVMTVSMSSGFGSSRTLPASHTMASGPDLAREWGWGHTSAPLSVCSPAGSLPGSVSLLTCRAGPGSTRPSAQASNPTPQPSSCTLFPV